MWDRGPISFFLHVNIHFFQYNLLKRLTIPHWVFFITFSKSSWPQIHLVILFCFVSGFSILFHWSVSFFNASPYCFDYYSFVTYYFTQRVNSKHSYTLPKKKSKHRDHFQVHCMRSELLWYQTQAEIAQENKTTGQYLWWK